MSKIRVRLNPEKVRQLTISGIKIKYHRLDFLTLQRMYQENLVNGELTEKQQEEVAITAMGKMICDWEGLVNDETDKPLEYKPEYIRFLPSMLIIEFFNKVLQPELEYHGLTGESDRREKELKNSEVT